MPDPRPHPLDMLRAEEIDRAREAIHASGRVGDSALFAHIVLHEPTKDGLARWSEGEPVDRRVRALIVPGPELDMVEAVVSVTDGRPGEIVEWRQIDGMRPALLVTEVVNAMAAVTGNAEFRAALARRGITDVDRVQVDPWPAGAFGLDVEKGRRIARCVSFLRPTPESNGYARPIEGLLVDVDLGRAEVLAVVDHGVTPMPGGDGSYRPEDQPRLRNDLRPIAIAQPEGPSFTIDQNLVRWQKWRLRVGFDPYEGLVLHQVAYEDEAAGRTRPILHRASISEMVVPYGDPSPVHGWRNAFDAGEWGLGRLANSLELGCDCVGEVRYLDAVLADEQGRPSTIANAICLHEEDYGIGWKHVDLHTGHTEVRRSRRLVVSFVSTVGNYEYGFFWYFYLDGTIQLEVKLTGIVSPMAFDPAVASGDAPDFANVVADGVAAPHHQHLFNARLDFDVDGPTNVVQEVEAEPVPPGPDNPWANAFRQKVTTLATERQARRNVDASRSRSWRIVNPSVRNGLGQPVAYRLLPTMATPVMLADPASSVGQRAGFARHNLWVTPYAPDERRAAGEFPNQHDGGDGLPRWTAGDRPLTDTDVVCWYTFGVTHFARPEDWPVMPVEYCGFVLSPAGFFDRNPALDVPPAH
jgi:primary-amine oxidase